MTKPWYKEYNEIICNYRFITLNEHIVPWSLADEPRHDKPVAGGYCGTLSIDWLAATPVLIGETGADKLTNPKRLKDGDKDSPFIIPGKSLRGMIGSVLRIATWSALGPIDDKTPSWRNPEYQNAKKGKNNKQAAKKEDATRKTGWLSMDANGEWKLANCKSYSINLRTIQKKYNLIYDANKTDISKIHKSVNKNLFDKNKKLKSLQVEDEQITGNSAKAHIIYSGKIGNKKKQYFFYPPNGNSCTLPEATLKKFIDAYSSYQKGSLQADSNLKPWLEDYAKRNLGMKDKLKKTTGLTIDAKGKITRQWDNPPGIPVYYYGDLDKPENIIMGMTQIMKLPADHSIRDVAARTQKHIKPTKKEEKKDFLDWYDALFGFENDKDDKNESVGLKGRISFGFATAPKDSKLWPAGNEYLKITQMEPRPGYFPTYLHHVNGWATKNHKKWQDFGYDSESSRINGRKRYPLKKEAHSFEQNDNNNNNNNNNDNIFRCESNPGGTFSALKFIKKGAIFSGEIKFHNLHRLELGALLWCLSLGDEKAFTDEGGKQHHSVGRLKAFWFGQLKPKNIKFKRLVTLPSKEGEERKIENASELESFDYADLIQEFKIAMGRLMAEATNKPSANDDEAESFFDEAVAGLLKMTDPSYNDTDEGLKPPSDVKKFIDKKDNKQIQIREAEKRLSKKMFNDFINFRKEKSKDGKRQPETGENSFIIK